MVLITLNKGLKLGNSPNGPSRRVTSHVGSIHDVGILARFPIHLNYQPMVFLDEQKIPHNTLMTHSNETKFLRMEQVK